MMKLKIALVSLLATVSLVSLAAAHSCGARAEKAGSCCSRSVRAAKSGCGAEAKAEKAGCGSEAKAACGGAKVDVQVEAPVEAVE